MRIALDELRDSALAALEEVATAAEAGPVPKSSQLRFLLAFLAQYAEERWPFDAFWKAATNPAISAVDAHLFGRRQSLNAAAAGIYVQLGLKRP
ncbi:MAG: hypothetical protein QOG72_2411 [Sphingomonadales bacterium]|jgi:hypothetical protein|nr:hypothetical protein [Sphingomonadales bacterium]